MLHFAELRLRKRKRRYLEFRN